MNLNTVVAQSPVVTGLGSLANAIPVALRLQSRWCVWYQNDLILEPHSMIYGEQIEPLDFVTAVTNCKEHEPMSGEIHGIAFVPLDEPARFWSYTGGQLVPYEPIRPNIVSILDDEVLGIQLWGDDKAERSSIVDAAKYYGRRGWYVWPDNGKEPLLIAGWQHKTLCDSMEIDDLFTRAQHDGVSVQLGPKSKIIDIECDGDEAATNLNTLVAGHLDLTKVVSFKSTRGPHHLFNYSEEWEQIAPRGKSKFKLNGIEFLLGTNGVACKSTFPPSGIRKWIVDPNSAAIEDFPEALMKKLPELLARQAEAKRNTSGSQKNLHQHPRNDVPSVYPPADETLIERARGYLETMDASIEGDNGSGTLFRACCVLTTDFALTFDEAWPLIFDDFNVSHCFPRWDADKVRHKIEDAVFEAEASRKNGDSRYGRFRDQPLQQPQHSHHSQSAHSPVQPIAPIGMVDLFNDRPYLKPPLIHGLLRRGEVMNIIAASKEGKSFLADGLALSVCTGRKWLNFDTQIGRVLIIDNELHLETISSRLDNISKTMNIQRTRGMVDIISLRGKQCDIYQLRTHLAHIASGIYSLVLIDALYRMLPPGTSENDNVAMMLVFNALDRYAEMLDAAIVCIHHSSKGDQSAKTVTDVGSGAGSISRAPDTHLILRPHEQCDTAVLEVRCRSFESPDPVSIEWNYPLWRASKVAPQLKLPVNGNDARQSKLDTESKQKVKSCLSATSYNSVSFIRSKTGFGEARVLRAIHLLGTEVETKRLKSKKTKNLIDGYRLSKSQNPLYADYGIISVPKPTTDSPE